MSETPALSGWRRTCVLSSALFVLAAGLSVVPVVRELQVRLLDSYFRTAPRPEQPSRAVLVLIDDESLQRYGRWPWPRTLLAQLSDRLAQAGAAVVGLDILLAEPQSAEADAALRAALGARTVLVDKIGTFPDGPRWIEPLPDFAQAAGAVGHAQAVLDRDGICRRFPPLELTTEGPRWAFAVEVARRVDPRATAAFLAQYDVPVAENPSAVMMAKPVLAPIAFRRDGFRTFSAAAVLDGKGLSEIRGRPVLVGFGPAEISDRMITPVSGELPTPGVEVHAHIFDSIVGGRALHELALGWQAALLLLACVVAVAGFSRWRGWLTAGVVVVLAIAVYCSGWLAFTRGWHVLPIGPMLLAVVAAPVLVHTADFVVVERSLNQQLRELRRWLASRRGVPGRESSELSWRLQLLRELQAQLGSFYELHETVLEATQDLVAIFDESGGLLLENARFAAVFRQDDGAAPSLEAVRARLRPKEEAPLLAAGRGMEGEAYVGDALYFVRLVPLPPTTLAPGGGTVVLLTDLATRVERDRARGEALGFITHELRTPLVSIQGFAEVMKEYPGSPGCAEAPETIFRESKRLLALINSYLDVLRLDAGARPVRMETVRLDELVGRVFELLRAQAAAAQMTLRFDGRGPIFVRGDEPLLTGAVLNLVSNALKYGREGTEIRVECSGAGEEMVVSVQNQGPPVPEAELTNLFEPFRRGPAAEPSQPGWGLGLAFVKRIAEKHGGSVQAVNRETGVSFELHLPATIAVAATKGGK